MLLSTPFTAVTNLPIDARADDVSGLTVSIVGVAMAEACCNWMVTPVIAPLTTLLALLAGKLLTEKLASCAAVVWVRASAASPPSPPDCVTVMAFAAPVAVPVRINRDPPMVVIMLAVTPGLFAAELIAAAMPDSELLVESMVREMERDPTATVRVPVPTAAATLACGLEVSVAEGAKLPDLKRELPGTRTASGV